MGTPTTTFSAPNGNCCGSELCPLLSSCVLRFLVAFPADRKLTSSAVWWAEGNEASLTKCQSLVRSGRGAGPESADRL